MNGARRSEVTVGCGSAAPGNRLSPAVDLAASGLVDYLGFDRLSERTLAVGQIRRLADDRAGHDARFGKVLQAIGPYLATGPRVIGNFGVANVDAAVDEAVTELRALGAQGTKIGAVRGDDVRDLVRKLDVDLPTLGCTVSELGDQMVSANAYIGMDPLLELLERDARLILGGRIADPSLFAAPICHELGWAPDDWDRVALAILAGHLLEGGWSVTGGGYADPPMRMVPGLHDLPFPFARIRDGEFVLQKLPGSNGAVEVPWIKTRIGYELHDPSNYLTPDVTADFHDVFVEQAGPDQVRVVGATGRPRPEQYKVLVGFDCGWKSTGEISYGGLGAVNRARLAEEILRKRVEMLGDEIEDVRFDLIGMTSLYGDVDVPDQPEPYEVRLRVAARCRTKAGGEALGDEVQHLYFGPAGGGGVVRDVSRAIGVAPAFVDRSLVDLEVEVVTA